MALCVRGWPVRPVNIWAGNRGGGARLGDEGSSGQQLVAGTDLRLGRRPMYLHVSRITRRDFPIRQWPRSGVSEGDLVAMYMPVIPRPSSLCFSTRLGAEHSVVFGGFAAYRGPHRQRTTGCHRVGIARRRSTGSIEAALATYPAVAECAVVAVADEIKDQPQRDFVERKFGGSADGVAEELIALVRNEIGAVARLKLVGIVQALPKRRSGKILCNTMRSIAHAAHEPMPSTIDDPTVLDALKPMLRRSPWQGLAVQRPSGSPRYPDEKPGASARGARYVAMPADAGRQAT